jgi:hypothetical protein
MTNQIAAAFNQDYIQFAVPNGLPLASVSGPATGNGRNTLA